MVENYLEMESDMPADWEGNTILCRDGKGRMIEVVIPDDEEVAEDA